MNLNETPRSLMMLAPSSATIPTPFRNRRVDGEDYTRMLHQVQTLRGQVYLRDGAIKPSSLNDGRHESPVDTASWHLLVLNGENRVCGCARYHEHPSNARSSELAAARSALARNPEYKEALFSSLRAEIALARSMGLPFAELGGWALDDELRGTAEVLRIALATYAFWLTFGGAVCISTATRRHCSSSILRRIGGRSLGHNGIELPAYYDPQYDCEMEILKFYSWSPNPRYDIWIEEMRRELCHIPIVASHSSEEEEISAPAEEWLPLLARAKTA